MPLSVRLSEFRSLRGNIGIDLARLPEFCRFMPPTTLWLFIYIVLEHCLVSLVRDDRHPCEFAGMAGVGQVRIMDFI